MKKGRNEPLVSVIMPNYNNEKYLPEAIESILNQTYENFEFIIIDDCSNDGSWDLIKKYAKKDKRIRPFRNKINLGCTKSLNVGLKNANGIYIARMDSDDISITKRFEIQIDFLLNNKKVGVCGTNVILIDKTGKLISKRVYNKHPEKNIVIESPLAHPSVMFKKKLYDKYGGYNEKFDTVQDYEYWLRLYSKKVKFYNLQKYLLKYRLANTSTKYRKTKKSVSNLLSIKKHAKKKYGIKFGLKGNLRIFLEKFILLLPDKLIIFLFKTYVKFFKNG
jgi:glycosyltransferase involved in cell wall biosynthesis